MYNYISKLRYCIYLLIYLCIYAYITMYLPMPKTMAGYDLVPYFTSITDFKLRFSTLPITSLALITE